MDRPPVAVLGPQTSGFEHPTLVGRFERSCSALFIQFHGYMGYVSTVKYIYIYLLYFQYIYIFLYLYMYIYVRTFGVQLGGGCLHGMCS